MKRTFITILFISVFCTLRSQDVKVSAAFDSARIYIGDQIKFTVTIDQPSDIKLTLPIFKDTICKKIDILSGPVIDSVISKGGRIKISERYLVSSYDSGFYQVPPVYAETKNSGGLKRFYSDYSQLEVVRVNLAPVDSTAKFFDIIKPYKAPVTVGEILPWVLIALITAAAIWFGIKYFKGRQKNKPGFEPLLIIEPAHVIAFRELEKLKNEKLWQQGEIKQYYSRLTEILRQYLENRYNVYSLELTTF
jgi:hypothetical protein